MPDPISSLLGGVLGIFGQYANLQEKQAAAAAQIRELQRSAGMEEANAVDALTTGSLLGGRARMKGTAAVNEGRVINANSGLAGDVGTTANVAGGTAAMSELDAQMIQNNAARAAWGHRETARKYGNQAAEVQRQSDNALVAGGIGMAGSLLGIGGDVYSGLKAPGGS